jgi:hypothetical protein
MKRRTFLLGFGFVFASGVAGTASGAGDQIGFREPGCIRYHLECLLERLGLIPVDPFRHVAG